MTTFDLSHDAGLLLYALMGVVGLIILISRFKVNSFVALIMASLFVGCCSGMPLADIGKAFQDGVGAVLGSIAVVIGLGTILGKMLAESGGAGCIAAVLIRTMGEKRIHWAMMIIAFLIGIPVFFAVGLVLLIPILFTMARATRMPLLHLGIPLLAGLSVAHGLLPPHPGPMAAIGVFNNLAGKVDVGRIILYSLLIGFPTAIIAGPVFGTFLARRVRVELGGVGEQLTRESARTNSPGFLPALFTILLPVLLMLLPTLADVALARQNPWRTGMDFAGHPVVAMLVSVLFAFYSFGFTCGFSREQILKFSNDCLGPVAIVLLVVGAGGGFSKVLDQSGVGQAVAGLAAGVAVSPLLLGWLITALIRVATGSATVAITMAAGIIAPIAAARQGTNLELLLVAMGAGSLILSHVNDGGFWLVKEYFNLTVAQTLKTWTVMETIISVTALLLVLLLDFML
ncbi:MAG: gluconate:H+ symporter [Verrucomicrobiota bacterium]